MPVEGDRQHCHVGEATCLHILMADGDNAEWLCLPDRLLGAQLTVWAGNRNRGHAPVGKGGCVDISEANLARVLTLRKVQKPAT